MGFSSSSKSAKSFEDNEIVSINKLFQLHFVFLFAKKLVVKNTQNDLQLLRELEKFFCRKEKMASIKNCAKIAELWHIHN